MLTDKTFYCIGDSHVSIFSGTNAKQPIWPEKSNDTLTKFKTYKLGPVTAHNLCESGTSTNGREKLLDIVDNIPEGSNLILCFGEIDCRINILKKVDKTNISLNDLVKDTIDRYFSVVLELQSRAFNVFVMGVPPSNPIDPDYSNSYEWGAYGTVAQRNKVSKMFNDYLNQKCRTHQICFISIFDELMSLSSVSRQRFFRDGIHLNSTVLIFILNIIQKSVRSRLSIASVRSKTLSIEVTDKCDMDCPHCIWVNELRTQREMSIDQFKKLVQHAQSKDFQRIILQAEGEIFMHSHFQELFEYAVNSQLRFTSMATNGLKLDRFIDVVRHLELTISFDGITPDKFYKHRGGSPAQFKKIIENIKKATSISFRHPINVNHVLTASNYKEIPEIIEFCRDLGVDSVRFHEYHPAVNKDLPLQKTKAEFDFFVDLFKTTNHGISVKLNLLNNLNTFSCTQPSNVLLVGPAKELSPCCHIHTNKKYGVYGLPSPEFNSFITQFCSSTKRSQLPSECRHCSRVNIQKFQFNPQKNKWGTMGKGKKL